MKDKGRAKEAWLDRIFLQGFRPYLWIVGLGFLLYFKTLFFGFTFLDDNVLVLQNLGFLSNLANLPQIFGQSFFSAVGGVQAYYRPLVTLSFMLDAQWGGATPLVYHATNLIMHLLSGCLLFLLFINLKYRRDLALMFSSLFVVHPLLTDAVAWVPGRNELLLTGFVLSAVICLIRFLGTKRWYYYFAHLFLFLLALLTKEAAVVMIVLGLYYLHFIAKEKMFSFNARVFVAGWLAVAVPWFLLRQAVLANNPLKLTAVEAGRSLLRNLPVIIQSLGKILFPFNLSVMPTIRDTSFLYGAVALFLLGLAWFLTRSKRYGFVFFGLLWSFLFILPPFIIDFSLVPTHLESRMYLPLIGVLLVLLELEPIRGLQLMKRSVLIYFVLLLAVFSLTTFIYSGNFADRIVFWTNAAQTSPHSPLAHRNLGAMYYLDGQLDKAEPEYQKALELNPVEPMAHNNLGLIYLGRGGLKEAEAEFVKELEINPCYDNALFNLGLLYAREGRFKKARVLWEKTLQVNPGYNDARSYLRLIHGK